MWAKTKSTRNWGIKTNASLTKVLWMKLTFFDCCTNWLNVCFTLTKNIVNCHVSSLSGKQFAGRYGICKVMLLLNIFLFVGRTSGLPHPGKVLDFFCCPGKSLNFVCKSWKVLENVYRVFPWFTRTECEVVFFIIIGTVPFDCTKPLLK